MVQRSRAFLLLALAVLLSCETASGETITVQLLNGKSRKVLKGHLVTIILGDPHKQHALDLKTDRDGRVRFETNGEGSFQVRPIGLIPCSTPASVGANINYSVSEVSAHGIVTSNDCGTFNPEPMRGQVTVLARPASTLDLFRL